MSADFLFARPRRKASIRGRNDGAAVRTQIAGKQVVLEADAFAFSKIAGHEGGNRVTN